MMTAQEIRAYSHAEYLKRKEEKRQKAIEWCEVVAQEKIKQECLYSPSVALLVPGDISVIEVCAYLKENNYKVPDVITSNTVTVFW